jgi:hypothetical protein
MRDKKKTFGNRKRKEKKILGVLGFYTHSHSPHRFTASPFFDFVVVSVSLAASACP